MLRVPPKVADGGHQGIHLATALFTFVISSYHTESHRNPLGVKCPPIGWMLSVHKKVLGVYPSHTFFVGN